MITVDMNKKSEWYLLMPNISAVEDMIRSFIPEELRGNRNIVGNTLYMILYQKPTEATRAHRPAIQEHLFRNYKINGILDESTSVENILENVDLESAYKYFKEKGEL